MKIIIRILTYSLFLAPTILPASQLSFSPEYILFLDYDNYPSYNHKKDELAQTVMHDLKTASSSILKDLIKFPWVVSFDPTLISIGGTDSSLKSSEGYPLILLNPYKYKSFRNKDVLYHELFHLAHYHHKINKRGYFSEAKWVEEGVATLGQYIISGRLHKSTISSYQMADTSLVVFDNRLSKASYIDTPQMGHIALYFYFLYKNCGGLKLFNSLIKSDSDKKSISFINMVLTKVNSPKNKVCKNFENSFFEFQKRRFSKHFRRNIFYTLGDRKYLLDKPIELKNPYSASAYRTTNSKCLKNDALIEPGVCLQARFK